MCHLHTLGGPSPYTKKQIHDDIDSWVKGEIDTFPRNWTLEQVDKIFMSTKRLHQSNALTFSDYSKDVLRWATSGGAPASHIGGQKVRSKWAWGFSRLGDINSPKVGEAIARESLTTEGKYTVALKREPAKTREIISGPMASHIRQSYLIYRTTNWDLPSPAFNKTAYQHYMEKQFTSYCSIDGDRFDHNVPKWFVLEFVRRLAFDEETQRVVDLEIIHLNSAYLEFEGRRWEWQHGLLSGWRITSLLGTVISHIAALWIKQSTGLFFQHLVLGDDIILYSDVDELNVSQCVDAYKSFGIPANKSKSISGRTGEFLRKIATPDGILGYPALALKSVYYASPWLNEYKRTVQSEISHSWWTFCSRMLPHRTNNNIIMSIIERMNQDIWFTDDQFYKWVQTPMCMGGGGILETSSEQYWLSYLVNTDSKLDRNAYFYSLFGIGDKSVYRKPQFKKIVPSRFSISHMNHDFPTKPSIPDNINKTIIIMRWYFNRYPNSFLQQGGISFSRSVRGLSNTKLLEILLGQSDRLTSVVSLLHVGEQLSDKISSTLGMLSTLRPNGPVSQLVADMYVFLERFLENKELSLVTW
ncbi:hypothetical protein 2 [Hubei toti-like virus 13]|uniref:RNA-directed RNA polymerase n=1 Tax=Hubei toti-like virus 13 TaxID=1923301 RepID=A0A1L3KFE6_9VIRU|nr:hypothetical protein 2 [Hubei toti-like virus 13]APG76019.1 hypothetical protein 2 [Hubei toti-like virus 13]